MKKTIILIISLFITYISICAETITFELYETDGGNYLATINTANNLLQLTRNNDVILELRYYTFQENEKQQVAFSFYHGEAPLFQQSVEKQYFIIIKNKFNVVCNLVTKNEFLILKARNNAKFISSYNRLTGNVATGSDQSLSAEELFQTGIMFEEKEQYSEALSWFKKSANQNYAPALNAIGLYYYAGLGVSQDFNQAARYFKEASNQDYESAMFYLGACYEDGKGVVQNYSNAFIWYEKAAIKGYARAANKLGMLYLSGKGVEKNPAKAVKWFTESANSGHAAAMYNLGYCYEKGEGVSKDIESAKYWYRKAADLGDEGAIEKLNKLQ